jgi:gliding motility-associated-like protein
MKKLTALLLIQYFLTTGAMAQTVSTAAGMPGVVGSANGPANASSFNNPHGVACDKQGNVYIANRYGHTIRKLTPAGVVSVLAGSGSAGGTDATGTAASFNEPWAVACDTLGNVYVADTKNYKIRKITPAGVVTTVAGTGTFGVTNGAVNVAQFGFPSGIAVSPDGSLIYTADRMTHTIRKISGGTVTTFAGTVYSPGNVDATGTNAKFDHPYSLALDNQGNVLVADEYNNKIRKITPAGVVTTFAGDGTSGNANGPVLNAQFNSPWGVCTDPSGDVFVGDANNFTVRTISQGTVSVYAGQDGIPGMVNGPALQSSFNGVSALWYNTSDGALYLCDPFSQLIRKITPQAAQSITVSTSTGSSSFCVGASVTLVASPPGLTNYVFLDGGVLLGTSATGTLTVSNFTVGTHDITCTATNAQGITLNSNTLALNITNGLTVNINTSGSTNICQGDSVTLTASVNGSVLWSNGATTQSITVANAGSYSVTVTNAQGCSGQSAPLQITTLTPPLATITSSTTLPVCNGDSVQLTAGNATSYLWSNGATTQITYATSPGNYTVMVSNGAGCSAISLPITVNFYTVTASVITPSGNPVIPAGGSITLTANSGTAYEWSDGQTTQSITVNAAGTYTVTVTDNNGCPSTPDSVTVTVVDPANMVAASGPLQFCDGDSVRLTSQFTTGNQWIRNGSNIPGATQRTYTATTSGYYQVRYTPVSGSPITSDSIQVTVHTLPSTVATTSDSVCKGSQAVLSATAITGITYSWYDTPTGGLVLGTGLTFTTPPIQQTASYYVETENNFGCKGAVRFEADAVMLPQPVALFTASVSTPVASGFEVTFTNTSLLGASWTWDFGDPGSPDNISVSENPSHIYAQPGEYTVTLITTGQEGCSDTLRTAVKVVMNNNIFIPSGFTPNNDGNNDLFRVRGNNILYSDMSIYNQWGQRIWFSEKEQTGWDGRVNGDMVGNGTYAYVIEVHYDSGNSELFRGNISVIR